MATKAELKARLSLDTALFERGIHLAQSGASKLGSTMTAVGGLGALAWGKLAAAAAALGGAAGFVHAVKGALEFGSSLKEMSDRTGIAVDKLVYLQQAFKEAGLEADDIGLAINRMQRFIEKAGPEKLGQAFFNLRQMRPEQQFQELARVISAMPTAMQRAAAAQEAFGRGGGKLLQVFAEMGGLRSIQKDLGTQAELLKKNAEAFDKASDLLKRTATQFRGFFVGVAAGIINVIGPLIERMSKLDFTQVGQKFGQALITGAQAVVGFFRNPEWLAVGLKEGFKVAIMEAGNLLIAIFKTAITFFQQGLVSMFVGLGDVIIGVLMEAFAKPIAYLQAGIEYAAAKVPGAIENEVDQAKAEVQTLSKMLGVIDKARDQAFGKSQAPIGSISDEERQKARERFLELQASHEKLMAQRADAESRAAGNIPSVAERAQRILREGAQVGIFEQKTAQQYLDEGAKELSNAFDKAAEAVKNMKVPDVLGAGQALQNAMLAFNVAVQQGQEAFKKLPETLGLRRKAGPGESQELVDQIEANKQAMIDQMKPTKWELDPLTGGMKPVIAAAAENQQEALDRMQLSLKQRYEETPVFTPPPMMRDIYRPGAIMGAFGLEGTGGLGGPHAVVSERHARREAWLREKAERGQKEPVQKSNELLEYIKTYTGETADAWKEY